LIKRFAIPDGMAQTTIEVQGAAGVEWLRNLPSLLAECERRWSLAIGPPFPNLSYNYAAPAIRQDGTPVVLKAGFPDNEFKTEAEALRLYAGSGAVQLLDADVERGILLLEHITPGRLLSDVRDDEEATAIAAQVMRQLWRPVAEDHPFPTVADWAKGMSRLRKEFGGGSGPFPARLVGQAERLFEELLSSMGEPVLLHGDLHHFNILSASRQPWLAIDPKGVVGEPEYEVGALLRNPTPEIATRPGLRQVLRRRIDQLSQELGFDKARLRDWSLAQAVLSAWWSYEDHGSGWDVSIAIAESLAEIEF
jgi:streptomycin 6-kinase